MIDLILFGGCFSYSLLLHNWPHSGSVGHMRRRRIERRSGVFAKCSRSAHPHLGQSVPRRQGTTCGYGYGTKPLPYTPNPFWLPSGKRTVTLHFLLLADSLDPTLLSLLNPTSHRCEHLPRPSSPHFIHHHSISLPFADIRLSASCSDIGCSPEFNPPRVTDSAAPSPAATSLHCTSATFIYLLLFELCVFVASSLSAAFTLLPQPRTRQRHRFASVETIDNPRPCTDIAATLPPPFTFNSNIVRGTGPIS